MSLKTAHILTGTGDEALNSRLGAAYRSGKTNTGFDLLAENTASFQDYVDAAGNEDLFLDLDSAKIAGFDKLTVKPTILTTKLVPYRCTTVVFAYDAERIPEAELPHTWDELAKWIEEHPGRFAYNEPDTGGAGRAFVQSAVYRLIEDPAAKTSNDPAWAEKFDPGLEWLVKIHPFLYKSGGNVLYPNKNQGTLDLLINQKWT